MRIPIYLDRDGVINKEPSSFGLDYVTEVKYFIFLPRVLPALKMLFENGYDIYIISNQAGVSKSIFTIDKLREITDYMLKELKNSSIEVKAVKYCIHLREENCDCRKPKTKFLEDIYHQYNLVDKDSISFVGDQEHDIETAFNFGIKSILVLSGKTKVSQLSTFRTNPVYVAYDLYDAVKNIILKS